jgi:hypothetical protein
MPVVDVVVMAPISTHRKNIRITAVTMTRDLCHSLAYPVMTTIIDKG